MIIDKYNKYKKKFHIFIFIIFLSFSNCQDDNNISNNINNISIDYLNAECNGNTLNYNISINLKQYLINLSKNFSQIENKPIYSSIDDIKTIGVIEGSIYEKLTRKLNILDIKTYKSYDEIISELKLNLINACFTSKEYGDIIKMENGDLTYFNYDNKDNIIQYRIVFNNLDVNLIDVIKKFQITQEEIKELKTIWFGCDNNLKYVNKILTGENGNLTIGLKFNEPPFSYLDSDGNNIGLIIDLFYRFANYSGYYLNIIELEKDYDPNEINANYTFNLTGFLILNESFYNLASSQNIIDNIKTVVIIKKEYSNNKIPFFGFYDTIDDIKKDKLGVLEETVELTENIFNNVEYILKEKVIDLYNSLLLNEINGFLIDEKISEYYENKVNNRLINYPKTFGKNYIKLIFTNESITTQFNEFIAKIKKENLSFNEILDETTFNNITENDSNYDETINIIIEQNIIPYAYMQNGKYKGYEINLLYNFSYLYHYNLVFNNENETNNVYIGNIINTNETDLGFFTDTIYESNIVFTTRKDKLRNFITIKTLDSKYREKKDNDLLLTVKYSENQKPCFCIVPSNYNNFIIIECFIYGFYPHNRFNGNYEYIENNNKIMIANIILEAKNLFEANSIFKDNNIFNHSNLENIICPSNVSNINNITKSSSGFKITTASIVSLAVVGLLFAGAILTIIIMYAKGIRSPKINRSYLMNSSTSKINNNNI